MAYRLHSCRVLDVLVTRRRTRTRSIRGPFFASRTSSVATWYLFDASHVLSANHPHDDKNDSDTCFEFPTAHHRPRPFSTTNTPLQTENSPHYCRRKSVAALVYTCAHAFTPYNGRKEHHNLSRV